MLAFSAFVEGFREGEMIREYFRGFWFRENVVIRGTGYNKSGLHIGWLINMMNKRHRLKELR